MIRYCSFKNERILIKFGRIQEEIQNNKLLQRIDSTSSVESLPGSGRPRTTRTVENIERVEALVLSQEDMPQTRRTDRQIARETSVYRSYV